MSIREYFGKDSRPLQDVKDSLLEWGDESLLNYNIIRKIVIVDVKCYTSGCAEIGEGEGYQIDLVLILKTGELRFENVTESKSWGDTSITTDATNYISIATNQVTKPENIIGIRLETVGCMWNILDLHVQVATVSGSQSPVITGRELHFPTDKFKTLNGLHTLIYASVNSYFYIDMCNPVLECFPTIPSAPLPTEPEHQLTINSGYSVTIKWKKPDFSGHLKILRYEVWSSRKNVWMDAGLKRDKQTFTYTINYDEDGKPVWDEYRGFCDIIKIRAVNEKGHGLELICDSIGQ